MKMRLAAAGLAAFALAGCDGTDAIPESPEQQISSFTPSSEDVVDGHEGIENLDQFETFYANVENGQEDNVRVVRYTVEGAPILLDLAYDGEQIKAVYDTTRDGYGSQRIVTTTCDGVDMKGQSEYILTGCESGEIDPVVLIK